MSESTEHHRRAASGRAAGVAVLTVSDSRTPATDTAGDYLEGALRSAGHRIAARALLPDEPERVRKLLETWLAAAEVDVIVTTGGTGIARRDTTAEVVERLLLKPLPGFGELFRMLSWQEIGAAAMLSRAVAGLADGAVVFTLPGSPAAVRLAMERLILPELPHLLWERSR